MDIRFVEMLNAFVKETKKPVVRLRPGKSVNGCRVVCSRFLGFPYLPEGEKWPTGSDGEKLSLLAQLNFEELPKLEGFPHKGILQIFVAGRDKMYGGRNFMEPCKQEDWRIIYRPDYEAEKDAQGYVVADCQILGETLPLEAELTEEPMTIDDFRFDSTFLPHCNKLLGRKLENLFDLPGVEYNAVMQSCMLEYSRMGGYTRCTQQDIRGLLDYPDHTVTLLSVCSDHVVGLNWVDYGTLNFFIEPERLAALDFSNVLYQLDFC